jgi:hypothetical protein
MLAKVIPTFAIRHLPRNRRGDRTAAGFSAKQVDKLVS